jgi:CheY-like chemotaxis protein
MLHFGHFRAAQLLARISPQKQVRIPHSWARKGSMMDVLLVDDNADYLTLMKEALFASGYTVHTAADGIEGCEVLTTREIDLIISDIRMPRFDGIKLHAFAREMERYARTKFVFISGFRDVYSAVLKLDPELDFSFDKTTPIHEIVKFIDKLMFGNFAGQWRAN